MLKSAQEKARTASPRELSGPSTPKPFRVRRRKGGFRIYFGDRRSERVECIEVKVAYDRRNGSPLRKYSAEDFHLAEEPILIEAVGAKIDIVSGNNMVINVLDSMFDIAVTGFDANRDLYLDVKVRDSVSQTAEHATSSRRKG